jgi:hypothetical protein
MEKQKITAQVHMLPQNKEGWNKGELVIDIYGLCIAEHESNSESPKWKAQHIYFTTDEEIKKGDWITDGIYVSYCNSTFWQQILYFKQNSIVRYKSYKKIVASTDPALGLPAIPTTWIRDVYVPSNGSIKEVSLQIEAKYDVTTGIFTRFDLVFDDDGSVIIVDETIIGWSEEDKLKVYNDGKSSNLETYDWVNYKLPEKHGGPYTYGDIKNTYRKGFYEHQELEDAAKESVGEIEDMAGMAGYNGFIKGATWQKEQSATDAIEFFKWVNLNYIEHGSHYEDNIKVSSYVHRSNGGVPSRIEKLYELFQTSKTN